MFTSTATDPAGDPRCNCVRADDGRLLGGPIGPGTDDTLAASIATLLGSLPESAWVQQQPKPFVARSVTVCVGAYVRLGDKSFGVPRAPAELMPRLPGRAPVLFAGRELVAVPSSVINEMRDNLNCYEMTMDEARGLAEQLLGPSVGGTHAYWGIALRDPRLDALTADPTDQVVAYVSFYGKMPDWAPNW